MDSEYFRVNSHQRWFAVLALVFGSWAIADDTFKAPGERIAVGQYSGYLHRLHIHCTGPVNGAHLDPLTTDTPTVILEAGLGGTSLEWQQVQAMLAHDLRVCSYDRAGMGWSGEVYGDRDSARITDELHELLVKADVPGPYVLVAHSFGGYTAQLFASRHPELSAGLVLIDASHPDQIDRFAAPPIRSNIAPRGRLVVLMAGQVPTQLPEPQRRLVQRLAGEHKARLATTRELEGFRASAAQLQAAAPLPDIPLVVLSRGLRQWPDDERGNLREALWRELQTDLALRSALGAQLIARHSGHFIHLDQPELVVQAIRVVVDVARQPNHARRYRRLAWDLQQLERRAGDQSELALLPAPEPTRLAAER